MKRMKHLFNFLLVAMCVVGFSACSDDENTNENIQVENKKQLDQTVTAEDAITSDGISFITTGAWTSAIRETTATRSSDTPQWISITPDHGTAAGNYTITVNLEANFTGEARTAVITIMCGDSKIEIKIRQEATTQGGEYPSKYEKVVSEIIGSVKSTSGISNQPYSYKFEYDDQNRLKNFYVINKENDIKGGPSVFKYTYSYDVKGEVRVYENESESYTRLELNNLGYAKKIVDVDAHSEYCSDIAYVTYSATGYISKIEYDFTEGSDFVSFNWNDGKISSVVQTDGYDGKPFFVGKPVYSAENVINNKVNIDLNVFFWDVDYYNCEWLLFGGPDKASGGGEKLWIYGIPGFLGRQNKGYVVDVKEDENSEGSGAETGIGVGIGVREDKIPAIGTISELAGISDYLPKIPFYRFDKEGYPTSFEYGVEIIKSIGVYKGKEPSLDLNGNHIYEVVDEGGPNERKLYYYRLNWDTTQTTYIDTYTFTIQYKD